MYHFFRNPERSTAGHHAALISIILCLLLTSCIPDVVADARAPINRAAADQGRPLALGRVLVDVAKDLGWAPEVYARTDLRGRAM